MNYNIQSTPTAIIITPDRKIVEQYIWPPTHQNLNDALLAVGGIMVGVEENVNQEKIHFDIYPNPAISNANIAFNSSGNSYQLEIFNLTGNSLYSSDYKFYAKGQHTVEINADGLREGMYFVSLRRQDQIIHTQRLIKL